jgi:hypothetical protein
LNKLRQVEVAVAGDKSVCQAVHGRTATRGICQNSVLDPVLSRRNGIKHWHTENENTGMYGRVRY